MKKRIVDLTFPIMEGMTTYPKHWHPVVEVSILGRHGIEGRETRKLILGTHTGTHLDAPRHFIENGITVDKILLETLVGPAQVIDLTWCGEKRKLEISDFEKLIGNDNPERLVLKFNWCHHINSMKYYTDHPYLSIESAKWLLDKDLKLLAMDTPQPDNPFPDKNTKEDSPVHKVLLGGGVILVEYLHNLKSLNKDKVDLIVLPLKILEGDGSPVRCIAVEDE